MEKMSSKSVWFVMTLLVFFLVFPFSVQSETIELKYATPYGPKHPQVIPDVDWMAKMEKATNGQLKFRPYFGGTLMGPLESYDELRNGVADLGTLTVAYSKSGFDIHKGIFPFMYGVPDSETNLKIFRNVAEKFPEIYNEFKELKTLRLSCGSSYQLLSRKPIRTVEDMKGLSIKATGLYVHFIKAAGGEGVPLPMSETFIALQKGTIDALLSPPETLKTFKFAEVAPYVTMINLAVTPYPGIGMNMNTWNKLPADIQKIINDSRLQWESDYAQYQVKVDEDGVEFAKTKGVEFITPQPEALNHFYEELMNVCRDSAKNLNDKGFSGSAIFNEFRSLIKENTK